MSVHWIGTYNYKGSIGVLVELSTLTSSIQTKIDFKAFADDIAMHIAATNPKSIQELLSQPFVKNPELLLSELMSIKSKELHDSISISRFIRWKEGQNDNEPEPIKDPAMAVKSKRA